MSLCRGAPRQSLSLLILQECQPNHGAKRVDRRRNTAPEAVTERLIQHGLRDMAAVVARAFELAMQIERDGEEDKKMIRDEMRPQKHRFCSIERAKPHFPDERALGHRHRPG